MAIERRTIGGSTVRILANGVEIGWGTNLDGSEEIEVSDVRALGDVDVKELKIMRRSVTFSVSQIRIVQLPGSDQKIWPVGGTLDVVRFPAVTFEILDDDTNQVVERVFGCKPTRRNFRCDEGGLYTENMSWKAVRTEPGDRVGT